MNELTLFAGAGLGMLGTKLLGFNTSCAVEINPYCRSVLFARQRDGIFERFPVWDDVRTFDAKPWLGHIKLITAGIPCPRWSEARHGAGDPPDFIGETVRIISECRPQFVLIENVRGFRTEGERLKREFAAFSYDITAPLLIKASSLGAPILRSRCWLLGSANGNGQSRRAVDEEMARLSTLAECHASMWWQRDPAGLVRIPDGRTNRMDRLHAAGQAQIPGMVVDAYRTLMAQL